MNRTMCPLKTSVLLPLLFLASHVTVGDDQLIDAVKNADHATLLSLLDRKDIDLDASRGDGSTALSWAAYEDDDIAIDLLIRAGADVNVATDFHAVTPLVLACTNGNSRIVDKLLAAGADPNMAKRGGETPLMACANTGAE